MKILRVDFEVSIDCEGWLLSAKVSHMLYGKAFPGGINVFTLRAMNYESFVSFKKEIESKYAGYEVRFIPNGLSDDYLYQKVLQLSLQCAIQIMGEAVMGGGWPVVPQDAAKACVIHEKCMEQLKKGRSERSYGKEG